MEYFYFAYNDGFEALFVDINSCTIFLKYGVKVDAVDSILTN